MKTKIVITIHMWEDKKFTQYMGPKYITKCSVEIDLPLFVEDNKFTFGEYRTRFHKHIIDLSQFQQEIFGHLDLSKNEFDDFHKFAEKAGYAFSPTIEICDRNHLLKLERY